MTIVAAPLIGIALLLFAAAAISPAYVPWPRVATALYARRSDLMVFGFGASGIAFVVLCLQLLGP